MVTPSTTATLRVGTSCVVASRGGVTGADASLAGNVAMLTAVAADGPSAKRDAVSARTSNPSMPPPSQLTSMRICRRRHIPRCGRACCAGAGGGRFVGGLSLPCAIVEPAIADGWVAAARRRCDGRRTGRLVAGGELRPRALEDGSWLRQPTSSRALVLRLRLWHEPSSTARPCAMAATAGDWLLGGKSSANADGESLRALIMGAASGRARGEDATRLFRGGSLGGEDGRVLTRAALAREWRDTPSTLSMPPPGPPPLLPPVE